MLFEDLFRCKCQHPWPQFANNPKIELLTAFGKPNTKMFSILLCSPHSRSNKKRIEWNGIHVNGKQKKTFLIRYGKQPQTKKPTDCGMLTGEVTFGIHSVTEKRQN